MNISTLANAGNGVFINDDIDKNIYITEYSGDLISSEMFELLTNEETNIILRLFQIQLSI